MLPALMLPALPFTILMPALSLLLVFRTTPLPQKQGPCEARAAGRRRLSGI